MKTLIVDACTSDRSRTRKLLTYLKGKLKGDIECIKLMEQELYTLDEKLLSKRDSAALKGDFSDSMFGFAKQFSEAETIIFAAPYWDLSFPAVLKEYIETIMVCGLTFKYDEKGMPISLCRAKKLIYITTAGGYIVSDELGYGYIKTVMELFYNVKNCVYIKAEGLDIIGNDVEKLLDDAKKKIDEIFDN